MTRRFPMHKNSLSLLGGVVFFAACGLFAYWQSTQGEGAIINGLIEMSPGAARIFFLVLCALCLGFVSLGLFAFVSTKDDQEVVLEDDQVTVPGSTFRNVPPKTVRFADVTKLEEKSVSGQQFLTLVTNRDKITIVKSRLPKGAFEEISAHVKQRAS